MPRTTKPKATKAPRSFLYTDLLMALRSRIANGRYPPGSRLPSLAELTKAFGVSAITVRRALRELVYEGLVQGHQGLGVFVKTKPRIHRVLAGDPDRSIGDEIRRAGFLPRLAELNQGEIKADDKIAARLGLRPGASVFRHQKQTFANDEPVALHRLHMRPSLARTLKKELGNAFIFSLLKKHNIPIADLRCEFSSATVAEDESRLLQLPAGHPILRVDYTAIDPEGKPFLLGETICRPDRFVFEVNLPQRGKSRPRRPAR
jgi:DNA-binding GntR family transcriptional regulator